MPEPADSHTFEDHGEPAEVRPLPVLAQQPSSEPLPAERVRALLPERLRALPAPVLAATGGFLAGVATFVLARILRRPRPVSARRLRRSQARGRAPEIAATRSFLVDIHLLKR